MDDVEFGERLRVARKAKGWSQQQLADAMKYSSRQIRAFEKGAPVSEPLRVEMRRHLGDFDLEGDPVELAIDQTELVQWRKLDLKTAYQRHLFDQADAERRSG
jgi:transcriptional regulator with XRE-family HTH domain